MKKFLVLLILGFVFISSLHASSVQTNVNHVQTASSYIAPSGYEDKGFIGSIIADIFDVAGRIQNQYVSAFQMIQGILINNILRWDGEKFVEGTITDNGTNVGIGTSVLTERLNVDGRITTNLAPNSTNDVGNVAYNDARYINVGEVGFEVLNASKAGFNAFWSAPYSSTDTVSGYVICFLSDVDTSVRNDDKHTESGGCLLSRSGENWTLTAKAGKRVGTICRASCLK